MTAPDVKGMTTKPVPTAATSATATPRACAKPPLPPARSPFAPLLRASRRPNAHARGADLDGAAAQRVAHDAPSHAPARAPGAMSDARAEPPRDGSSAGAEAIDDGTTEREEPVMPSFARARSDTTRDAHDALDPLLRRPELLASPSFAATASREGSTAELRAKSSLEELLPALVRRVAWSGDGKKGAIVLEIGAGALAGATLFIEADAGSVRVRLRGAQGSDAELAAWRERIGARLAARRIVIDAIDIE